MREFKYVVTDPEGIHARPAGELVKAVKAFSSDIKIAKGGPLFFYKQLRIQIAHITILLCFFASRHVVLSITHKSFPVNIVPDKTRNIASTQ